MQIEEEGENFICLTLMAMYRGRILELGSPFRGSVAAMKGIHDCTTESPELCRIHQWTLDQRLHPADKTNPSS